MGIARGASIPGEIHNIRDGSILKVRAIMDQGNLLHPGVGMFEKFLQDTNIGYAHRAQDRVHTASVGSNLTRLGLIECFILKLEGFTLQF